MFRYLLLLTVLFLAIDPTLARAAAPEKAPQRIVLLAPAAGDILLQLGLERNVVGKTHSLAEFPAAQQVGSHIKPNVELIKALQPDLLVIGSNRFFSEQMAAAIGAATISYDPHSLAEILQQTALLAERTGRRQQGEELLARLRSRLHGLKRPEKKSRVIYEVSALPLSVAGTSNIVSDIIRVAGGEPLDFGKRKIVKIGSEAIIAARPELYLYQTGPMNKNPTPPQERGEYRLLDCRFLQVDQLAWSRANTQSFERVAELNRMLAGDE